MEVLSPAQLSFLTLYNPALGRTDETFHDQVLFYYSSRAQKHKRTASKSAEEVDEAFREDRNERLRQIGLAQGMVEFAKSFSEGKHVDAIDSEKSRIVLHELEPGWWMLASIDLTHIRNAPTPHSRSKSELVEEPGSEYSAREVAPQDLLLQNLIRAHEVFLLHHASSLRALYVKLTRPKFCSTLERYWTKFVRDWDVFLSGNPAVDIFNGLKLAAGGELGVGVGEEDWGSGEREVLEGFIGRTEGLVDMVVSRFGDSTESHTQVRNPFEKQQNWLGLSQHPEPADGVIFSGVGALTKPSVKSISAWMELIFKFGVSAYGVADNPQSTRKKRRRKFESVDRTVRSREALAPKQTHRRGRSTGAVRSSLSEVDPPPIPPPIVQAADTSLGPATSKPETPAEKEPTSPTQAFDSETLLKYMTLGVYGSSWGIPSRARSSSQATPRSRSVTASAEDQPTSKSNQEHATPDKPLRHVGPKVFDQDPHQNLDFENGCFLVGLQGDLSLEDPAEEEPEPGTASNTDHDQPADPFKETATSNWNRRILVRTLHVERRRTDRGNIDSVDSPAPTYFDRHRVVVYARRPFLFTFVFSVNTPTLSYTALYRSLHHQLGPLRKPLLASTSAATAKERVSEALQSPRTIAESSEGDAPIYDLVYDPATLSVTASIPGIPEHNTPAAEGFLSRGHSPARGVSKNGGDGGGGGVGSGGGTALERSHWTRIDALATHAQILNTVAATRDRPGETERLMQTSRGWWVVWLRLPAVGADKGTDGGADKGGTNKGANKGAAKGAAKGADKGADKGELHSGQGELSGGSGLPEQAATESAKIETAQAVQTMGTAAAENQVVADTQTYTPTDTQTDTQTEQTEPQAKSTSKSKSTREAFLVRRAADAGSAVGSTPKKAFGLGFGGSPSKAASSSARDNMGRIAEGIGVDARRYVEGLLSLTR